MLSDEEKKLWKLINKKTKKIKCDRILLQKNDRKITKAAIRRKIFNEIMDELKSGDLPDPSYGLVQLRNKSNIKIEANIDLHGCTQTEARLTLRKFFFQSQISEKRWVKVITGKSGVLFQNSFDLLKENADLVSGYTYAKDKDGGKGAIYVRIRQKGKNSHA
jgi:DNA-nicking Smr family endonuclease